jgi:hypothetical protein
MIGMVVDAEGALNHHGHPLGGPDIASEAIGWRPASQQGGNLGALLRREAWSQSGRWPVGQRLDPLVAGAGTPLADRARTDTQCRGDVFLLPPLLF